MKRDLNALEQKKFDILIIGGGISGGAIAWDAALRGHSVALVEKKDFGHATSMATSKMIHGGLRYLARFDLPVARESLRERRYLAQNAAHQVFPSPFLFPIYDDTPTSRWLLKVGLSLYDILSYDKNDIHDPDKHIPGHKWLSKSEVLKLEPGINPDGLKGGFYYYDMMNNHPERVNVDFIQSAAAKGAEVANYVSVDNFILEDLSEGKRVTGITAKDELTGRTFKIKADVTVNATGPWGDLVLSKINKNPIRKLARSKGIHLLFHRFTKGTTIAYETRDKHHFFIVPWMKFSLAGTTDTPYSGDPDDLKVSREDAEELIERINEYYPEKLTINNVIHSYAGLRPLVSADDSENTYDASRKHEIVNHRKLENMYGLISVFGGKYTTSRSLAEDTVDMLQKEANLQPYKCATRTTPLEAGLVGDRLSDFIKESVEKWNSKYPKKMILHLIEFYGAHYEHILNFAQEDTSLLEPFDHHFGHINAEITYAVKNEMAQTVSDFLLRRCGLGNTGLVSNAVPNIVAENMGQLLSWDKQRKKEEIGRYRSETSINGL